MNKFEEDESRWWVPDTEQMIGDTGGANDNSESIYNKQNDKDRKPELLTTNDRNVDNLDNRKDS